MSNTVRAIAYVRVSTDKQADSGLSLEAQETRLRAFAFASGFDLVEVIIDAGKSAGTLDRPGLIRARAMLRNKEANALIVLKLDRLARSLKDLLSLVEDDFAPGKAALISATEAVNTGSESGKLLLSILGAVAAFERGAAKERTTEAMKVKQSRGEFMGGDAPYGSAIEEGKVVPQEEEQQVMSRAKALRESGITLAAIGVELETLGHVARNGKRFVPSQVARMLR